MRVSVCCRDCQNYAEMVSRTSPNTGLCLVDNKRTQPNFVKTPGTSSECEDFAYEDARHFALQCAYSVLERIAYEGEAVDPDQIRDEIMTINDIAGSGHMGSGHALIEQHQSEARRINWHELPEPSSCRHCGKQNSQCERTPGLICDGFEWSTDARMALLERYAKGGMTPADRKKLEGWLGLK